MLTRSPLEQQEGVSMFHRTLRTSFVLILLIGLTLLVSASPVGASTRSNGTTRTGQSFHPTGHGLVKGHLVSTSTIPQVKGTGRGTIPPRPAPGGRAHAHRAGAGAGSPSTLGGPSKSGAMRRTPRHHWRGRVFGGWRRVARESVRVSKPM